MTYKYTYTPISQIGPGFNAMNSNENLSNPLTFCLVDANTSRFLHGSSSVDYSPYSKSCQIYMAEYASGYYNSNDIWNEYAQYYYLYCNSIYNLHPNLGAINIPMFEKYSSNNLRSRFNDGSCNVGKYLLRNTLERVLFVYNETPEIVPFFPNIPNSNLIRDYSRVIYNGKTSNCAPFIKNNLDSNPFIKRIMDDTANKGLLSLHGTPEATVNLTVCLDVLVLYNTLITKFNKYDPTNEKFTNFVIRLINNLTDGDIKLDCTDNSYFIPNNCKEICNTVGPSSISICSLNNKTQPFQASQCHIDPDDPSAPGYVCNDEDGDGGSYCASAATANSPGDLCYPAPKP